MTAKITPITSRSFRPTNSWESTGNNQRPDIARQSGDGANDWKEDQWDDVQYTTSLLFPTDAKRADADRRNGNPFSPARTSFIISGQRNPDQDPTLWIRLKRLHHDIGPDYTGRNRKRATIRRDERHRRYESILQVLEIPAHVRDWALRRAFREDISGFNGHYNGYHGAVLGFALLELTDDLDDALNSNWFDRMKILIDELPDEDVDLDPENLVRYVFRNYGSTGGEA